MTDAEFMLEYVARERTPPWAFTPASLRKAELDALEVLAKVPCTPQCHAGNCGRVNEALRKFRAAMEGK